MVNELSLKLHSAGLLDVTEDGIVTVDDRQQIVLFNGGAEKLFGYDRTEVIGRPLELLLPPRYAANHPDQVRSFAEGQAVSRTMGERKEVYGCRKGGEEFPADVSISKMAVDGRLYLTAIVRDVTERKRAQEAIQQLNVELEQRVAERTAGLERKSEELRAATQQLWQSAKLASVGEMAAGIAHELNNPLGIISLRLEAVLAKTSPDDPRRRALEIIEQELDRMAGLVANLLQFSRPGSAEASSVDLAEEVDRTLELMHHQLKKRTIVVKREVGPGPVRVHADRQKLRQVLLNLVCNAIDAMLTGGSLTVRVRPEPLDDGGPGMLIEVADTGCGIPADVLPRVMEPFFTTKEEGKGTGLGLAICRRIVQEHGGTIRIDSLVGRGTAIRIALPATAQANVDRLHKTD